MLEAFGSPAFYHVREGKLEPRANKGTFMGYGDGVKGFRIWSSSERKVILSRDAIFVELSMLNFKSKEDLGKVKDVTKQVEFESPKIENYSDQK